MRKLTIPIITLSLFFISTCLVLLPDVWQSLLYFDRHAVYIGEIHRLVVGHFLHGDFDHWMWNGLALLVLGALIEVRSRRLLVLALLVGIASVDVLLLSSLSAINYYCGLSGVLNALLAVVFWLVWRECKSKWVIISALLCVAKIVVEMSLNYSLFTDMRWPPYPAAHLAGALGGAMLILFQYACDFMVGNKQSKTRESGAGV